jgi:predicted metal-dependent phosphoesterase TrpH
VSFIPPVRIDLHVHSTASDGQYPPAEVAKRASGAGLAAIALTDHDTLAGLDEARACGSAAGVRVICGCEFSVAGPGGEMHLLGYFLPAGEPAVEGFLEVQRANRLSRAREIIRRLQHSGLTITEEGVSEIVGRGAWGRPHVARALVSIGAVKDIQEAFDRFIGFGKPAFVPKDLPKVESVTSLVRSVAGVTSAAHLRDRAVRPVLTQLKKAGVDGVEVLHPAHDEATTRRAGALASELGLLPSGGTDWHGDMAVDRPVMALGGLPVPAEWLSAIEDLHSSRQKQEVVK